MKVVTLVALEYMKKGERTDGVPGTIVDLKEAEAKKLIDQGHAREPSEAEMALYDRQNPGQVVADEVKENQKANDGTGHQPVKQQTAPTEPNGPGGATGEATGDNADKTVATDVNSVGAGSQGNADSSAQAAGSASTTAAKKTAGKTRKNDDLA